MWRDKMQQGSFRGVPFGCISQETEGGRRVARHEYPGRDDPWPEDMGRKGRVHSLELHIVGAGYMDGRDAMLTALEKAGPAELIHPWLGRLNVQVETYRLRESTREGGMATFSVSFVQAGKQQFPTAAADTTVAVTKMADIASGAAKAAFVGAFSVSGQPAWVGDAAIATLNAMAVQINRLRSTMPQAISPLLSINNAARNFSTAVNSLIRTPSLLADQIVGMIENIGAITSDPLPGLDAYRALGIFGDSMITPQVTTPARSAEAVNQQALIRLVKRSGLIASARAGAQVVPDSSTAALILRDDLAERLDSEMLTADDATYLAIADLRAAIVRDLTTRAITLPRIGSYTPQATMPALVLAHRIYGDAIRDADITSRNAIRHPGFVQGGQPLEVINA